ncbi:MAG: hypothetical protein Q9164_001610 [Protoblastenia rupestris]
MSSAPPKAAGFLHILLPAHESDSNVCKAVLGATVLGFPTPVLTNWGDKVPKKSGGILPHTNKLYGVVSYLNSLNSTSDEDLVVVVDAMDSWFQLSPQILIDRYFAINSRAQELIDNEFGNGAHSEGFNQSIVFSTQKECWPGSPRNLTCYTAPESLLPDNIYGPETDTNAGDDAGNPFLKFRARYLNSGLAMGPVGRLRQVYERAIEYAKDRPAYDSDQLIISKIFAHQQYMRAKRRLAEGKPYPASWKEIERKEEFTPVPGKDYEFGIGLDYEAALDIPTVHAEHDSAFIVFDKNSTIRDALKKHKIRTPTRPLRLQPDIANSPPPFSNFSSFVPNFQVYEESWSQVSLYTNLWTSITPVIIHHNAWRNGLKKQRKKLWDKMWYQSNARWALHAALDKEDGPVAVDVNGKQWLAIVGKDELRERGPGVRTFDRKGKMKWRKWGDLCDDGDQKEVFRDED